MNEPAILWQPTNAQSNMLAFAEFVESRIGRKFENYDALHEWSIAVLEDFWSLFAQFMNVQFHSDFEQVLTSEPMPDCHWFPGATLNYAEHALRPGAAKADDDLAIIFHREDGLERRLTHGQLRDLVARARCGLVENGIGSGDYVVALAPNCIETLVLFLACASLGAIWSSCSPDFGLKAVEDRFVQLEPKLLFTVDGYLYAGKRINILPTVTQLQEKLPSLQQTVLLNYLDEQAVLSESISWDTFTAETADFVAEPVAFEHPLWVLFSSGTTGLPKGIVHGHGGILLEHMKLLGLHHDLQPGEKFLWFTTTGWMMWNYLVSSLAVGAVPVLFDGSPGHPDLLALWKLVAKEEVGQFGASAPYIHACMKAGIEPSKDLDLSSLRTIGSTGAPLSAEGFRWISEQVGARVQVASVSGGTDVCTAFLGQSPMVPVWEGELSCAELGCAIAAFDESGKRIFDEVGELVILRPMPSMPVSFINDADGSRLREAYFEMFDGVWRHGDWVKQTPRNSYVIYGRSDSTLNRGGVRMGTADFYSVVESFAEVIDSLVVDTTSLGAVEEGELLCFVVLQEAVELEPLIANLRASLRKALSPRHVPDRFIPIKSVPRTLSGKKCEIPVKKILAGANPDSVVSRDALQDPNALDFFIDFANNPDA